MAKLDKNSYKDDKRFLLLDRDGVINEERENYVLDQSEFVFKDDFVANARLIGQYFDTVIVVTNQSCVGRGLISKEKLNAIHNEMIINAGTYGLIIEKVYFATGFASIDPRRKPNSGMLYDIMKDFPCFRNNLACMVGNRTSDMQFAKSAGITSIHYTNRGVEKSICPALVDVVMNDWYDFDNIMLSLNLGKLDN